MLKHWKRVVVVAGLSLTLLAVGCGADDDAENPGDEPDDNSEPEEETDDEDVDEDDGDAEAADDYGEEVDYTVVGVDGGAGVMQLTEDAFEDYGLDEWNLQSSSDAAMVQALDNAYENEEPIFITGWTPHWKFQEYDLTMLDDPEYSFGDDESIRTMAREGLEDDHPDAYQIIGNFEWEVPHIEQVMLEIQDGVDEAEAAQNWIDENEELVSEWTDGIDEDAGDGETISLSLVAWDTEIASTNVLAQALESVGYDVETNQVEANFMFASVAEGDADASTAVWSPHTHVHYIEDYEDEYEDLGPNLDEGALHGLTVPSYMDIESIEDLQED
ncbi:glycine betaine ABC transporter substrate-binding protein [Natribacillus halophilus]|uniref:Glycine betaine/proline transport system substrate-binding protein n=1 Tax=Natribacillus halophilus TaxID=549003 RepID=A0A1G8LXH9_9BACI|nr:glycine betaine ABC transporter substrate-binding protein [Natribacillus halophilus]SDI60442.1 glycine betaine/proline transport system substrate-binding protein [Natribacillus halophilus]